MPHGLAERRPPEGTPPLRILVIIASPDDQAEALNRKLNHQPGVALNLHEQGLIFAQTNRPQDAFPRFSESQKITRRIGAELGVASGLNELGKLYRNARMTRETIAAFLMKYWRFISGKAIRRWALL